MIFRTIKGNAWRRITQIGCFLLFLFLFIKTDYTGTDELEYAVNILFRIDPLAMAAASLAAKAFIALMWPALITVALTLILGRFFCGWICPLGTLLDFFHRLVPLPDRIQGPTFLRVKYYLLAIILAGAFFGIPIVGFFDPFSILVRGLALAVYPAFNAVNETFFTWTYLEAPAWINVVTEPVYAALKYSILPFDQKYYELALFSTGIILSVFLLELIQRRLFCRDICPLGGLFAVAARWSLLRGRAGTRCGKCTQCRDICRMGAIDQERNISSQDCNLCLDCTALCPGSKIDFSITGLQRSGTGFDISRRKMVGALAAGAVLPFFLQIRSREVHANPDLIRPPGALPEKDFLGRCVRCGECMKVCIGNGLQPAFLQAGIEGMFSPCLKARTGYCEFNCTLCGQVCPTGAIRETGLEEKQKIKIGNAFFDKNLCLPYAKGIPCIVCEEHCPTPDKAIKFRMATVKNSQGKLVEVRQPYLVDGLCVGCGICETKCPLPGTAAVRVTSGGESRDPENEISYL
ncbi:4Fe-4S binding protein [Thermodesulfobacteriota bacterium]